jgi:hypothetical protein
MHQCQTTVDRSLCIVLTVMMGAMLFAAEACMKTGGHHPAVASGYASNGAQHRGASRDATRTGYAGDRDEAIADGKPTAADGEEVARLRDDGTPSQAR